MSKVYLVGAGPGDPELITLKAKRLLEQADAVLYDHLAPVELLDLAPATAERVYVGKKKADHALSQEEICELLVERGRRGLNVVRLKGGDPFIFGRGGEEAEALADAGIPFEVVPGVTSPLGIAAYTGVPLTHRDHTSAVTFVTGHDVDKIDWAKVGTSETLVVLMGLSQFEEIARRVVEGGRPAETPAIAVRWGTRPTQDVVEGTLGTLPRLIRENGLRPPATVIVGDVVQLRAKLDWFEKLPLFGQTVVVTRGREQAASLADPLRHLGAEVVELPAIEIRPPRDGWAALDAAIARIRQYDWLIFTSANGVRFFLERLRASAVDTRAIRARICAIGPATADAVTAAQLKVDVMAEEYVAEGVLKALEDVPLLATWVLIPRAAVARDTLPKELSSRGAKSDVVEAYRTEPPEGLAERAAALLARKPDWITYTSTSTVEHMVAAAGVEAIRGVRAASIGPITSAALRRHGIEPAAETTVYTAAGLVDAILRAAII